MNFNCPPLLVVLLIERSFLMIFLRLLQISAIYSVSCHDNDLKAPPNILLFIVDDLGFNDVPWNSEPSQIHMPNLNKLAKLGIILNQMRTQSVCTPSRSEIFTGRHIVHTGVYDAFREPLSGSSTLPLKYLLLPEILKNAKNYSTHLIGKWHLGSNTVYATPTYRGYDTHYGFYDGKQSHYNHSIKDGGFDFYDNFRIAWETKYQWSTDLITKRTQHIITNHSRNMKTTGIKRPLFLTVTWQSVHGPVEAPERFLNLYKNTTDNNITRQLFCAMASHMDEGVGNITDTLQKEGLFDNTLIIFTSDNGGPSNMQGGNWASNYPLRGGKGMLFEGGIRVPAFISGAGIAAELRGAVSQEYIAGVDITPTIIKAATGKHWTEYLPSSQPALLPGDGIDLWEVFSKHRSSPRKYYLLETHHPADSDMVHGFGIIVGKWKLINLHHTLREMVGKYSWVPPPGQDPKQTQYFVNCRINVDEKNSSASADRSSNVHNLSNRDALECVKNWCLFDLQSDPCETNDLSKSHPKIVNSLLIELDKFSQDAVPIVKGQGCMPVKISLDVYGGDTFAWAPCDHSMIVTDINTC